MKTTKNFVLIGRSGSGKGTQAEFLMEYFGNLVYISTGALFRELAKADTVASKKVIDILESGGLPFDDLATTLWMHEIAFKVKEDQGFIMDGAPRRPQEAQNLDRFLEFLDLDKRTFFILIDISREEAFKRLSARGRSDDSKDAINSRMDYYEKIVRGVVEHYESRRRLIRINGEQSVEDVHKDIMEAIQ